MAMSSDTTELDCGRDLDEVWAHADAPPDSHEASCPYCQTARASLTELTAATRKLREDDLNDASLSLDAGLLTNIFSMARAEVRRGATLPLQYPAEGSDVLELAVTEQAIATVVLRVSDSHAGIEARRCHIRLFPADHHGDEPVQVVIELTVGIASGMSIPARLGALRLEIIAAVVEEIGVVAAVVDIHVEDVLTDDAPTEDGRPQ